jgi:hypothetical protein
MSTDRTVLACSGGLRASVADVRDAGTARGPAIAIAQGRGLPVDVRASSPDDRDLATPDAGDTLDRSLAEGVVGLWGGPHPIAARRDQALRDLAAR